MNEAIRILLVDDHALVRRGFRRLIEDEADLKVVGEGGDGAEAVRLVEELLPHVVVMDYAMPEMNGVLACRQILSKHPQTRILILSMHAEPQYAQNSFDAGATGYLLKNALDLELVEGIRKVAAGERVLDTKIQLPKQAEPGKRIGLTTREMEVLQLIAAGNSNKQIAALLAVSINTVAVHRANIMDRLGMHNAAELVAYAIKQGLVSLP